MSVVGSCSGYTRVRLVLAGCESDTANIMAVVVALSQQVVAQDTEVSDSPFIQASACRMLAESPCFCTGAAIQLTLQRCAVSSRLGVRRAEEGVEG